MKLRHLARDPRCVLVVFEAVRPFRGVEVRGVAELIGGDDVASARTAIAGRHLGVGDGERLPPNGDPRQGCCSDSFPTVRGCGIYRGFCRGRGRSLRWRYRSEARATAAWVAGWGS